MVKILSVSLFDKIPIVKLISGYPAQILAPLPQKQAQLLVY